ncbi:MAG: DUF3376 domain-containing protein, partial [Micromonosporaceae bacterium]
PAAALPAELLSPMRRALAAAELMLGPVRTDPFTEPSKVNFHAITASRVNPVERRIFGDLLNPEDRADRKLSGNQLSNFAAFLSARWRQTDWTWGRLDAVPSLVQLMVRDGLRLKKYTDDQLVEKVRDLYLSGPPELAPTLATEWEARQADSERRVDAGTVRERFADAVADRLQLGILYDELPVLQKLESRGAAANLPPAKDAFTNLPAADLARADMIAKVGEEKLPGLLDRFHTRRAATRVGFVGWRAVQPGGGWKARLAQLGFGLLKPLALLPVLAAVASPLASIAAAFGAWLLVAAVAGTWSHPLIQPILAAGFAITAGIAVWRLRLGKGWAIAAWAGGAVALVVLGGVLVLSRTDQIWDSAAVRYAAVIIGLAAAVAPFWWLAVSGWRGVRTFTLIVVGQLVVLGVIVWLDANGLPGWATRLLGDALTPSGWLSGPLLGLVALYAVLAIPTLALTWLFPPPPD